VRTWASSRVLGFALNSSGYLPIGLVQRDTVTRCLPMDESGLFLNSTSGIIADRGLSGDNRVREGFDGSMGGISRLNLRTLFNISGDRNDLLLTG